MKQRHGGVFASIWQILCQAKSQASHSECITFQLSSADQTSWYEKFLQKIHCHLQNLHSKVYIDIRTVHLTETTCKNQFRIAICFNGGVFYRRKIIISVNTVCAAPNALMQIGEFYCDPSWLSSHTGNEILKMATLSSNNWEVKSHTL